MKVQTVKFPQTPEATLEEVNKLRVFIDKYHQERFNYEQTMPSEMVAVMWHSAQVDFLEVLNDEEERVGVAMVSIYPKGDGTRGATMMAAYIDEPYRGKGLFKQMIGLAKVVYRARNITTLDIPVDSDKDLDWFGNLYMKTYRSEL